jgi:RNA polymerase sigma-70 factor (sigma-E family)
VGRLRERDTAEEAVDVGLGSGRLAELYARHAPAMVRLGYLLTGDRGVAEDLAQDAFVRVAGRLGHLRDPGAFEAYLRRTVVNMAKNHFRRRSLERSVLARSEPPLPVDSPEGGVVGRHAVMGALDRLPPRQRAAVVLRFYEDLPEDRIADLLRCRPGTARSLVSRGVQALRIELQETSHG